MNSILEYASSVNQVALLVILLIALGGWAVGEIWLSRVPMRDKWLWTAIVVVCPIIGCLLWFVLGPKAPRKQTPP